MTPTTRRPNATPGLARALPRWPSAAPRRGGRCDARAGRGPEPPETRPNAGVQPQGLRHPRRRSFGGTPRREGQDGAQRTRRPGAYPRDPAWAGAGRRQSLVTRWKGRGPALHRHRHWEVNDPVVATPAARREDPVHGPPRRQAGDGAPGSGRARAAPVSRPGSASSWILPRRRSSPSSPSPGSSWAPVRLGRPRADGPRTRAARAGLRGRASRGSEAIRGSDTQPRAMTGHFRGVERAASAPVAQLAGGRTARSGAGRVGKASSRPGRARRGRSPKASRAAAVDRGSGTGRVRARLAGRGPPLSLPPTCGDETHAPGRGVLRGGRRPVPRHSPSARAGGAGIEPREWPEGKGPGGPRSRRMGR